MYCKRGDLRNDWRQYKKTASLTVFLNRGFSGSHWANAGAETRGVLKHAGSTVVFFPPPPCLKIHHLKSSQNEASGTLKEKRRTRVLRQLFKGLQLGNLENCSRVEQEVSPGSLREKVKLVKSDKLFPVRLSGRQS